MSAIDQAVNSIKKTGIRIRLFAATKRQKKKNEMKVPNKRHLFVEGMGINV